MSPTATAPQQRSRRGPWLGTGSQEGGCPWPLAALPPRWGAGERASERRLCPAVEGGGASGRQAGGRAACLAWARSPPSLPPSLPASFPAAFARSGHPAAAATMVIKVYIATSSGSTAIKKQQQDMLSFLEANKIEFEEKDIAANEENRKWMRENVPEDCRPASGNPLPPRLFSDSRYLGDYEAFFEARENNAVYAFLGLTAPPGSKEAEALAKQEA
uniref:adapter SH3BGRL n=1 Tax=Euleptes europaea TaxID=460621 RepID=UPI00254212EF|nr:adapter SH3BGRL [Euleptes europaea]